MVCDAILSTTLPQNWHLQLNISRVIIDRATRAASALNRFACTANFSAGRGRGGPIARDCLAVFNRPDPPLERFAANLDPTQCRKSEGPRTVSEGSAPRWETVNVSAGGRDCFLVNRNLGSENPPRGRQVMQNAVTPRNNTVRTGAAHCGIMRNYICIRARVPHDRIIIGECYSPRRGQGRGWDTTAINAWIFLPRLTP